MGGQDTGKPRTDGAARARARVRRYGASPKPRIPSSPSGSARGPTRDSHPSPSPRRLPPRTRVTRPFLVLQLRPEDVAADGEFNAMLRHGGLGHGDVVRVRAERTGLPAIDFDRYSGIIVGGSPFDVSATEKSATQKRIEVQFMELFDQLVDRDFPFLGACSGNGLLGKYCGANISPRYAEPIGGADVLLTPEGEKDPLLAGFPTVFRVLLGHKEACDDVPPGTTLLASSSACPVQMFRLGGNLYATQFHPEADPEGFRTRIEVYKDYGYFPPETADDLMASITNEHTPFAQRILNRFVRRYRQTD